MSSETRITYRPREDATADGELNALAAVFRFCLFESSVSIEGGPDTAPDNDAKESKNDCAVTEHYT